MTWTPLQNRRRIHQTPCRWIRFEFGEHLCTFNCHLCIYLFLLDYAFSCVHGRAKIKSVNFALQGSWRCCTVCWWRVLKPWTSSKRDISNPSSPCWTSTAATTRSEADMFLLFNRNYFFFRFTAVLCVSETDVQPCCLSIIWQSHKSQLLQMTSALWVMGSSLL